MTHGHNRSGDARVARLRGWAEGRSVNATPFVYRILIQFNEYHRAPVIKVYTKTTIYIVIYNLYLFLTLCYSFYSINHVYLMTFKQKILAVSYQITSLLPYLAPKLTVSAKSFIIITSITLAKLGHLITVHYIGHETLPNYSCLWCTVPRFVA